MAGSSIRANVFATTQKDPQFPEQTPEFLKKSANCGICFSGGGTRALASTAGQMRALHKLGLLEKARYISCVSGGSWASGAYTYYQGSDDEFLGPYACKQERAANSLEDWGSSLAKGQLAERASVSFADVFWKKFESDPGDMAWIDTVRAVYFEPFGLGDACYFTSSIEARDEIIAHNPKMDAAQFHVPKPARPYLIINGTLEWPVRLLSKVNRVLVQFTSGYVGNPWALRLRSRFLLFFKQRLWTGGGFLDSFAFGSKGPSVDAGPWLEMPAADQPFAIWHASGISSAAFGYVAAKLDIRFPIPREQYWAVENAKDSGRISQEHQFTDGGNLENFGLMAMLQRKVEKLVLFVDSEIPLPSTVDGEKDSDVSALFGVDAESMPNNQVFAQDDYSKLMSGWIKARANGGLAMSAMRHTVLPNMWFGIDGGWQVEILWVYNAPVTNWINQLSNEVQSDVANGIAGCEPLAHFPNYRTIDENRFLSINLTKPQAALLADMYAWSIEHEWAAFHDHLPAAGGGSKQG